jgi:hypothetical protein
MQRLLSHVSHLNSFPYVASQIFVPFSYNHSSLLAIARSLYKRQHERLLYERHVYFFDFYELEFGTHPVWINLIRDPIYRTSLSYKMSRANCRRRQGPCFVSAHLLNGTIDQCIQRRSPRECISSDSGVSRMLPFFCGLIDPTGCDEESDQALAQAKRNIEFFYTVVGFAEDFYKFLFVLGRSTVDELVVFVYDCRRDLV